MILMYDFLSVIPLIVGTGSKRGKGLDKMLTNNNSYLLRITQVSVNRQVIVSNKMILYDFLLFNY